MFDTFSGSQFILPGLMILVTVYLMRRSLSLGKRSRNRDPAVEVGAELRAAERTAEAGIRKMEVRMHNYGREVEGRVQTTLTLLDRLIAEADQESERLGQLLQAAGQVDGPAERIERFASLGAPLTREECGMVRHLKQAGYTVAQIARLLRRSPENVESALEEDDGFDTHRRTDAA